MIDPTRENTVRPAPQQVSALILAAGLGLRMGMGPKAYLSFSGQTLLERAVDAVAPFAQEIIVGVPPGDEARCRAMFPHLAQILAGGATRQETVSRLLRQATHPIVLLHEVARPFVPAESFQAVLAAAEQTGAASLFVPLQPRDSLALMDDDGALDAILPRARAVTLQTPHAYRRDILLHADEQALANGWKEDGTAAMVRHAGHRVQLVRGSEQNVKLTYASDLASVQRPATGSG